MFLSSAVTIYKPAIGPQRHIPPWRGLFPDQMIYNFLKIILYLYKILFKKSLNRRKGYKTPAAFLVMKWNSHCSISLAISTALLSIQGNPKRHSSADFIAKDSQTMFLTLMSQIL